MARNRGVGTPLGGGRIVRYAAGAATIGATARSPDQSRVRREQPDHSTHADGVPGDSRLARGRVRRRVLGPRLSVANRTMRALVRGEPLLYSGHHEVVRGGRKNRRAAEAEIVALLSADLPMESRSNGASRRRGGAGPDFGYRTRLGPPCQHLPLPFS